MEIYLYYTVSIRLILTSLLMSPSVMVQRIVGCSVHLPMQYPAWRSMRQQISFSLYGFCS